MTGYNVTRDCDVKISPEGERDQHHADTTFTPSLPVTSLMSPSLHRNIHLYVCFALPFVSCIWTFLLSPVQSSPIMLINPSYISYPTLLPSHTVVSLGCTCLG